MNQITGVGAACMDALNTIEFYPKEDGSTHILKREMQGGGACATALAAASRLGVTTALIGTVGADETGSQIRSSLESEQIDTTFLDTVSGTSPISEIMVSPDGKRTKFVQNNTLSTIAWTKENIHAIKTCSVLHLDGTRYDNAVTAAEYARKSGVLVSLDGCHMEKDLDQSRKLASLADILIMNARYPKIVSGKGTMEEALRFFHDQGSRIVASTQGDQGVIALIDNKIVTIPAFTVNAVDTTGAGDVFHGAFLAAYLSHDSIYDCFLYASAASAIKCTKSGGRSGIPTNAQVLEFLALHNITLTSHCLNH